MTDTLLWLAEEIAAAAAGAPPTAASYGLDVYCGDRAEVVFADDLGPWDWVTVAEGLSLWGLRRALETAYAHGWSACSVYAYRED